MLAEGADVNKVGMHGYSALTWASTCNHLEIATALLEHGSDVNKPTNIGVTPMSAETCQTPKNHPHPKLLHVDRRSHCRCRCLHQARQPS